MNLTHRHRLFAQNPRLISSVGLLALLLTVIRPSASAQTYQVLFRFTGGAGGDGPLYGAIARDAAGNFYGTVSGGSGQGCLGDPCGLVFKVSPSGTETVLHEFTGGTDGAFPVAGLTVDAAGNLYGTTTQAGSPKCQINPNSGGCGTVFKINKSGKFSVNYSFRGPDGAQSWGNVFVDAKGDLYGTTLFGGNDPTHCIAPPDAGCGVIFRMSQSADGKWKESVLHSFIGGSDGWQPFGTPITDSDGNVYGTAASGDSLCNQGPADACGVVFKISPSPSGWIYTVLYVFKGGVDGAEPWGGLARDEQGNLYGTTLLGGDFGLGTIFKVDPAGNKTTLHSFTGPTGAYPYASMILGQRRQSLRHRLAWRDVESGHGLQTRS